MIDNQCASSSHVSWRLPCMSFNGPRARVFASGEMDVCLEFSESCRLSRRLLVDVLTNLLAIHETKPWPYQHSQLNRRTGVYRWLLNLAHVSGNLVHFSFNNNLPTQKGWTPCFRFFITVKDCQVCYWISITSVKDYPVPKGDYVVFQPPSHSSLSPQVCWWPEVSVWLWWARLTSSDCFSSLNDFNRKGLEMYVRYIQLCDKNVFCH